MTVSKIRPIGQVKVKRPRETPGQERARHHHERNLKAQGHWWLGDDAPLPGRDIEGKS